jgi:basic membrane lipoprotein Med (substrate-binding protein (PBP1-ABC) superfamily)
MGIDLILLVVNAALAGLGGRVPSSVTSLIQALGPVISNAIKSIQSGQGKLDDVVTALGALSGVIAVLKQQTGLDPEVLAQVDAYDQAVKAGIAGYLDSKSGVDLSKLGPVAPIA